MTNQHHTVYYTGVTSDLIARVQEHKMKVYPKSFTSKYNINKLVYWESFHSIEEAIMREKQIKVYRREKKLALINALNPEGIDLFDSLEYRHLEAFFERGLPFSTWRLLSRASFEVTYLFVITVTSNPFG